MLGPYPYTKRDSYPHLSDAEGKIWERFIAENPDRFDVCWYDVELGTPRGYDATRPEPYRSHHRYLGGYKIDVLGQKGDQLTIIELKKQATTKALGEIWLYEYMYLKEKAPEKAPRLMIITDEEMPHIQECCVADEVELVVVSREREASGEKEVQENKTPE
jgi:hypothetical protein